MPLGDPYKVRFEGVDMFCCKPGESTWKMAVFHDTIRQVLLDLAAGRNKNTYSENSLNPIEFLFVNIWL